MTITLRALDAEFRVVANADTETVKDANELAETAFANAPEIEWMEFFVSTNDEEFAINLLSRTEFLSEGM
jgi:hypothetical protein